MAKYKNIKSVAHNLAYSFLSDMNLAGSGRALTTVPEQLYQGAKAQGTPAVTIDFLNETVEPAALGSKAVKDSLKNYHAALRRLLASQNVNRGMVAEAKLLLEFDFTSPRQSRYEPAREIPALRATATSVDDRGTVHTVPVDKWWCE